MIYQYRESMFEKINSVKKHIFFDVALGITLVGAFVFSFITGYGESHSHITPGGVVILSIYVVFFLHAVLLLWLAYKNYSLGENKKAIQFLAMGIILLILFWRNAYTLGYFLIIDFQ